LSHTNSGANQCNAVTNFFPGNIKKNDMMIFRRVLRLFLAGFILLNIVAALQAFQLTGEATAMSARSVSGNPLTSKRPSTMSRAARQKKYHFVGYSISWKKEIGDFLRE
jgi:hypothetical protein